MTPTVTDWISAVTGICTLIAAIVAGAYAGRAAHWTKQQAHSAREQADSARHQVDLAREQTNIASYAVGIARDDMGVSLELAELQRREAVDAARRLAEDRVDSRMPTVLIRATPGTRRGHLVQRWAPGSGSAGQWVDIEPRDSVPDSPAEAVYRLQVSIHVENLSEQIARVALIDAAGGDAVEVDGREGIVLRPPAQERTFTWSKKIPASSLRTEEDLQRHGIARVSLWVRDLGLNAYDVVELVLDLRVFERDGSRLIVTGEPAIVWQETFGTPLPQRFYDRLDATRPARAD